MHRGGGLGHEPAAEAVQLFIRFRHEFVTVGDLAGVLKARAAGEGVCFRLADCYRPLKEIGQNAQLHVDGAISGGAGAAVEASPFGIVAEVGPGDGGGVAVFPPFEEVAQEHGLGALLAGGAWASVRAGVAAGGPCGGELADGDDGRGREEGAEGFELAGLGGSAAGALGGGGKFPRGEAVAGDERAAGGPELKPPIAAGFTVLAHLLCFLAAWLSRRCTTYRHTWCPVARRG